MKVRFFKKILRVVLVSNQLFDVEPCRDMGARVSIGDYLPSKRKEKKKKMKKKNRKNFLKKVKGE